MLRDRRVHVTLPTQDLAVARAFWEDRLGFEPFEVRSAAILYRAGEGTLFAASRTAARASGSHTQMAFTVPDIEAEVRELRAAGIEFEAYDYPTLRTVDGIAELAGVGLAAWFKDPDGNLIGLVQFAAGERQPPSIFDPR